MWFVYVEGHGKYEYLSDEQKEMTECVRECLKAHQVEAITVVEGEDITNQVMASIGD